MRYCLTIAVRGRITRPIHFCFAEENERNDASMKLIELLESRCDDHIVFVNDCGFLKRDFVSFALIDDEDDDEGKSDDRQRTPLDPVAAAIRIATHAQAEDER